MSDRSNETIRARLEALIRTTGSDYAALSRMLGRNASYVQQFVKYGVPRKLSEEDRRVLASHFSVPEEDLGGPIGRVARAHSANPSASPSGEKDYMLVPYFDVRASAGHGNTPDSENPENAVAFQTRWVRSITSGSPDALSVIQVEGDSMSPTLSTGDQILVDRADRERLRDGIYVLRVDDVLLVKRLSVSPATRRLTIVSDNQNYPSWPDCDPESVDIIGRVVWAGRKL
jgi:hypothetical protein